MSGSRSSSSSWGHRRSRSLSRFPPPTPEPGSFQTPSSAARFVNKTRGGGGGSYNTVISLDDLADEFLRARAESEEDDEDLSVLYSARGRDTRRTPTSSSSASSSSSARYLRETQSSKQRDRGRSLSKPPPLRPRHRNQSLGPSRTRYSSVVHPRTAPTHSNHPKLASQNSFATRPAIRTSITHKHPFPSHDSGSTHSSLTEDEARDVCFVHTNRNEKTIPQLFSPDKEHPGSENETGLYEAMRNEVRNAVEEIRTQLEKVVAKAEPADRNGGDDLKPVQVIAELRKNYTSKLEESEKRKQELLAELAEEEQRGQELTKIVKELLPSESNKVDGRQSRARRRSKERSKVSRHLTEEAERYFEDFLSNVDDTDFSSFDEERSDTSSCRKDFVSNPYSSSSLIELQETPVTKSSPLSPEADGIVLPWLQWETDLQTSPLKPKPEVGSAKSHDATSSSHASWSPEYGSGSDASFCKRRPTRSFGQMENHSVNSLVGKIKGSSYHKDEYLDLRIKEDFILERMRQRERIESGSLILCERILL